MRSRRNRLAFLFLLGVASYLFGNDLVDLNFFPEDHLAGITGDTAQADAQTDYLAADKKSAQYRTGKIDPLVLKIPAALDAALRKEPDNNLSRLVQLLAAEAENEFRIVKRIYDWITLEIAYDSDAFLGRKGNPQDTQFVVANRRTTCGGFSKLFIEMCRLRSIRAEYISGKSRRYQDVTTGEWSGHAWNAVEIDGTWYLVDCTSGNRRNYRHNKFSELRSYSDTSLFIHPQAKIMVNIPDEPKWQLLDRPLAREEFHRQPMFSFGILKYPDLKFLTDLKNIEKIKEICEGGNRQTLQDGISLGKDMRVLAISAPDNYRISSSLYDDEGKSWPEHTFVSRQEKVRTIHVTLPGNKMYWLSIKASKVDKEKTWDTIYRLRLLGTDSKGGMQLPPTNTLVLTDEAFLYGLSLSSLELPTAHKPWYTYTVDYAPGYEIHAGVYNKDNERNKDYTWKSYPQSNQVRFWHQVPDKDYTIKIWARKIKDTSYKYPAAYFRPAQIAVLPNPVPPELTLFIQPAWYEAGLAPPDSLMINPRKNGIYALQIQQQPGLLLAASLKDESNTTITSRYGLLYDIQATTVMFSSPGPRSGEARIYRIDGEAWKTLATFKIPQNTSEGPELPLHAEIIDTSTFQKYGHEHMGTTVKEVSPGVYYLAIRCAQGLGLGASLLDVQGKSVTGHDLIHTADNRLYNFTFSAPGPGRYIYKIMQIDSGGTSNTICMVGLNANKKGPELPAGDMLGVHRLFHDYGLTLISSDFTAKGCRILVNAPADVIVKGVVKDLKGTAIYKNYTNTRKGTLHTFEFSSQTPGVYQGWLWAKRRDEYPDKGESYFRYYVARFGIEVKP